MVQRNNEEVKPLAVGPRRAAVLLGISERLLWSKSITGEIPSVRIGRRRLYVVSSLEEQLAKLLKSNLR